MFPYTVKYTESESDIQNINLLYKRRQTGQNTFLNNTQFRENQKYIFFKKFDFKMISVLWRFSWPAFGGPKILIYIYIYIYIHIYTHLYIYVYFSKKAINIRNNNKLVLHRLRIQAFVFLVAVFEL